MDPSVAMAKLLATALENRLNAPVPDGESGTQHTSCAEAPCFIANDYCLQAARVHVGSRTASPHVVLLLCRFACNWQYGAATRACRSAAGATSFGAGGCALADAPVKVRSGGGGGQGQDEHGERSVESCCKWCAERHFAVSFARFLNSLQTPLLPHCYKWYELTPTARAACATAAIWSKRRGNAKRQASAGCAVAGEGRNAGA